MRKRKLPQCLIDKQEKERAATVEKVTNAIIELTSQGYDPWIKDIVSYTHLSRSVFAKPHIRKVLVEYGVVVPRDANSSKPTGRTQRNIDTLLAEKDGYIERLRFTIDQLQQECELLRGKIHLLMHKGSITDNNDF